MKKNNLILFFPICNTNYEPSRRTNWGIWRTGWEPFYDALVWPAIEWARAGGFQPRVHFHWPQGRDTEAGERENDFDAWIEAVEQGQHGLVDDYIPQAMKLKRQGIEVITYMDSLRLDSDFSRLLTDPTVTDSGIKYMDRFYRSVWPYMLVGGLAFDNVVSMYSANPAYVIGPDHIGYSLLCAVRNGIRPDGGRCYVEAGPRNAATWWHDWNIMVIESTYRSRHELPLHPGLNKKKDWWPIYRNGRWYSRDASGNTVGTDTYTGEIVRMFTRRGHHEGGVLTPESVVASYKKVAEDGHTIALRADWMLETGVDASELEL